MQASTSEAVSAAATTLQNVLLDKEAQHLVAELHGVRIIAGLLQSTDLVLLARATGMPAAMNYILNACCTAQIWSFLLELQVRTQHWGAF